MTTTLGEFLEFLDITEKSALESYADRVVIRDDDFVSLILACMAGSVPIGHIPIHRNVFPDHLDLTDENLSALAENGVGPLSKAAKKTVNKVVAAFDERRLLNVHFFWPLAQPREWHLFYFDQRDASGEHWVRGAHMHLMNYLTHPKLNAGVLLERLQRDAKPPKLAGLHVRYDAGKP